MDSSLETHQSDGERGAIGSLHSPGKHNARSEFLPVHAPSAERHYSGGGAQPIHDVVVSRLFYHREQESHKRLVTKHFFDSYRGEEFLLERYLPSYRLTCRSAEGLCALLRESSQRLPVPAGAPQNAVCQLQRGKVGYHRVSLLRAFHS